MMVIDPDGGQVGTLGGGCVENEVKQKAIQQIGGTAAAVHSFVLDHDYAWADGLICGGKMVILTQPVRGPGPLAYFRALDQVIEEGEGSPRRSSSMATQAGGPALGSRFLFDGEGRPRAELAGRRRARRTRRADRPARRSAQAVGSRRRRVLAELAADPADRRRGRARGAGRRQPGGSGGLRRLGRRRPPSIRQSRAVSGRAADPGRSDRGGARRRSRSPRRPMP